MSRRPSGPGWQMGMVGWSVACRTLLGAALGLWLDARYPGGHSWTLMWLAIGLGLAASMPGIGWRRKTGKSTSRKEWS